MNDGSGQSTVWERIIAARVGDGHIVVADADLIVRAATDSVYDRTGWNPEGLVGRSVIELLVLDDRRYAEIATDHLTRHLGVRPPGLFRISAPNGEIEANVLAEHIQLDGTTALAYHLAEIDAAGTGIGLILAASQVLDRDADEPLESTLRTLVRVSQRFLDLVGSRFLVRDETGSYIPISEASSGSAMLGADSPFDNADLSTNEHQAAQRRAGFHAPLKKSDSNHSLSLLGVKSTVVWPLITDDGRVGGYFETLHLTAGNPDRETWAALALVAQIAATTLEHRRLSTRLAAAQSIDQLTGLSSRQALTEAITDLADLNRAAVFLLINIDGFGWINNTLGTAVGDGVLIAAATRLKDAAPEAALCGRWGSDEFAVLIPYHQTPTAESALALGREILEAFDHPLQTQHLRRRLTVSIGVTWVDSIDDPDDLVSLAAFGTRAAKETGGNTVQLFDQPQALEYGRGRRIGSEILRAVENQELFLEFQPIIDLQSRQMVGVEALVRWNHPDWGLIAPDQFVPAVEVVGLAINLDAWVIGEAARWIHEWHPIAPPEFRVWVNASGPHFRQQGLARRLTDAIDASALGRIGIEISEEAVFADRSIASNIVGALRDLKIPVALDDFGTGKSSLETLHWLEADSVKIDRSFIIDLASDKRSGTLVEAMINLSHGLGATVVAEGVESSTQLANLDALGADKIQGYVAFRPLAPSKIAAIFGTPVSMPPE